MLKKANLTKFDKEDYENLTNKNSPLAQIMSTFKKKRAKNASIDLEIDADRIIAEAEEIEIEEKRKKDAKRRQ